MSAIAQLAIDGGTPVRAEPFPGWPFMTAAQVAAAERVLRSGRVNYWTGVEGLAFESEFAEYAGARHALSVANGTVGLELALRVCRVGAGDEVVVPARTFIATASSAVSVGARPVCADVDRDSGNVTAATIEAALTPNTRAVIVVHLAGWPCEMDAIVALCRGRGIALIEDCAQSTGAMLADRMTGTLGDVGVFSFCQDKIVTTAGEGGMLVTGEDALFAAAWSYRDHGKDPAMRERTPQPGWGFRYVHESFGTNLRMTEVQSAVGRAALESVAEWVEARRRNAVVLDERLAQIPGLRVIAPRDPAVRHAYYKYYAYVEPDALISGWDRDRVGAALAAEGIPCGTGACPELYLEQAFTRRGWGLAERLPIARELGETSLMLRVDPALGETEMHQSADALAKVMREAVGG